MYWWDSHREQKKLFHSPQHVPIFSVSDLFNDNYDKVTINFMTTYYCSFESRSPYKSSYCWSSCPGVLDRLVLLEERMGKKGTKVRWFSVDGLQWSGVKEKENQVKLKLENIKEKLASLFLSVCWTFSCHPCIKCILSLEKLSFIYKSWYNVQVSPYPQLSVLWFWWLWSVKQREVDKSECNNWDSSKCCYQLKLSKYLAAISANFFPNLSQW